jgi:hypothetical protein
MLVGKRDLCYLGTLSIGVFPSRKDAIVFTQDMATTVVMI